MVYRLLTTDMDVNHLIMDWSRYAHVHGMTVGGLPGPKVQSVRLISNDHECTMNIENPEGTTSEETLRMYLGDFLRRHTMSEVAEMVDEAELRSHCNEEDRIGFIV